MLRTVLALAAAAALSSPDGAEDPGSEAAPPAFRGCAVTSDGAENWQLDCPTARLLVHDNDERFVSGASYDETMLGSFRKLADGPVARSEEEIPIAGEQRRVTRLHASAGNDLLYLSLRRPEGVRSVACLFAPGGEDPCPALLARAAAIGWRAGPPPSLRRELTPLTLAGRTYEPPPGCSAQTKPGGFYVRCADQSSFGWAQLAEGLSLRDSLRDAVGKVATMREEVRDCVVEGVRTRCTVLAGSDGDPVRSSMTYAELAWSGQRFAAICVSREDVPPFPAVCASAMSMEAAPPDPATSGADVTVAFAGRTVEAPDGCRAERTDGQQRLTCEATGALLSWIEFDDLAQAKRMLASYGEALAQGMKERPARVPCRIGGAATTCNRHGFQRGQVTVRTYLSGVVEIGRSPIFAVCAVPGDDLRAPPCSALFELDPR